MYPDQSGIGEKVRRLRGERIPRMTQQELAERAGISVDVVRKLEQGRRQTVLVGTLHAIARALDVDASALLSGPMHLAAADDEQGVGIRSLRRAVHGLDDLTGIDAPRETVNLNELRRSTSYAWGSYWAGDLDALGALLPSLIGTARATTRDAPADQRPHVAAVLAEIYQVAACMIARLGHIDLAHLALERALTAVEGSDDPLRRTALLGTLAWLLQSQGRLDEAEQTAVRAAERCEPRISTAAPAELSVWGNLLVTGATAAARAGRIEQSQDLLNVAQTAAVRVGGDRNDYQTLFGPSQVTMQATDVAVVSGQFGAALKTAATMPPEAMLPPAAYARHLADVAYAQTGLGRDALAVDTLLTIERTAPHWMRYQRFPKVIIRELLERERRIRTPRLRGLAARAGLLN